MDRTERFYKIEQLLNARRAVSMATLIEELGVSRATVNRDLGYMRDRLNAPIISDRESGGFRFTDPDPNGPQYALPGLWLNASEIHALMTMHELLMNLEPGVLRPHVEPLRNRVLELLNDKDHAADEVSRRIRILGMAARPVTPRQFETVVSALLTRKRLQITHYSRERDEKTERTISPQRVVHYRDNWYVDAWCHERNALRTFSFESIQETKPLEEVARDISDDQLDRELGSGYGIFAGADTNTAKLRFSFVRARWVADEMWHPDQKSYRDDQDRLILEVPYSDDRELLMDILKHGSEVEVLAPRSLKDRVASELKRAGAQYPSQVSTSARTGKRNGKRRAGSLRRLNS